MNSELEQVVDLLQEYVIRLEKSSIEQVKSAPVSTPIIKVEQIELNEKKEKQEIYHDTSNSY